MKKITKLITIMCICIFITAIFATQSVHAGNNSQTGVIEVNGTWYYMIDGEYQYDYTGLVSDSNGIWYIKNGKVDTTCTGLYKIDGSYYYIEAGKWNKSYTGLGECNGAIWYVLNGKISFRTTGLCKADGSYYYIEGGKWNESYTGLGKCNGATWYVVDGKISFRTNGIVAINGVTYTVSGGKATQATGLQKIDGTYYYLTNGKVDTAYTGLAEYNGAKWYVVKGVLSFRNTGLYKIAGSYYYIESGKWNESYTGLGKCNGATWYVVDGKISFRTSGEVVVDGVTYTISAGKVTASAPAEDEETENTINMNLTFTMGDSWGTGMVYNIAIQNLSGESASDWVATVNVPSGTVLNDYWNCECSISGTTMTIKGKYVNSDYDTSVVPANGKVEGFGISINTYSSTPIGDYVITVGDKTSSGSGNQGGSSGTQEPEEPEDPVIAETGSAVANHGQLSVSGTQLVDKNGEPYRLCGVSTHGLAWYPQYVNKDTFQYFRDDWGANVIRLAMYTDEYGGYLSGGNQAQLETYIDNGVKYATELGMYVIIDWHILATNPSNYTEQAKTFFAKMASKYANYDNVLYEICNEPTGSDWNSVIKPYAEKVIATIRQYDKDAVVLVGTNTWSQDVDAVVGNKIADENVMYVAHFYAATHGESYRNKVITAIEGGVPVFISECSVCEASGNGGVGEDSANAWFAMLKKYNISYVAWNISNKAESSALISSSCNKLSGFLESELSVTGKWFRTRMRKDRGLN